MTASGRRRAARTCGSSRTTARPAVENSVVATTASTLRAHSAIHDDLGERRRRRSRRPCTPSVAGRRAASGELDADDAEQRHRQQVRPGEVGQPRVLARRTRAAGRAGARTAPTTATPRPTPAVSAIGAWPPRAPAAHRGRHQHERDRRRGEEGRRRRSWTARRTRPRRSASSTRLATSRSVDCITGDGDERQGHGDRAAVTGVDDASGRRAQPTATRRSRARRSRCNRRGRSQRGADRSERHGQHDAERRRGRRPRRRGWSVTRRAARGRRRGRGGGSAGAAAGAATPSSTIRSASGARRRRRSGRTAATSAAPTADRRRATRGRSRARRSGSSAPAALSATPGTCSSTKRARNDTTSAYSTGCQHVGHDDGERQVADAGHELAAHDGQLRADRAGDVRRIGRQPRARRRRWRSSLTSDRSRSRAASPARCSGSVDRGRRRAAGRSRPNDRRAPSDLGRTAARSTGRSWARAWSMRAAAARRRWRGAAPRAGRAVARGRPAWARGRRPRTGCRPSPAATRAWKRRPTTRSAPANVATAAREAGGCVEHLDVGRRGGRGARRPARRRGRPAPTCHGCSCTE